MGILLTLSCLMIVLNAVPRINDIVAYKDRTLKQWARLVSLCFVVLSAVWFVLALFVPHDIPADWAVTIFLASIASAWTFSPLVESWFTFVFKHGEPDRLKKLKRRKDDS